MQDERGIFYEPADILHDVSDRLAKSKEMAEPVDYLSFVPDGEPTLDLNIGREIALLRRLQVRIGVITNGSLLWREDVRADLYGADWVSLKIDSVQEEVWRRINRPHKALRLPLILDGILVFARSFAGRLATETMFVRGVNDDDTSVRETTNFLKEIRPQRAYLSIPSRPPAEKWVQGPEEESLNRIYQTVARQIPGVEFLIDYEGNSFTSTGDNIADLLNITAVHPMREDAVRTLLSRSGTSWEVIDGLVANGDIIRTKYDGYTFYLRRLVPGRRPVM